MVLLSPVSLTALPISWITALPTVVCEATATAPTGEFQATEKPLQLVTIQTRRATQARYRVDYTCPSEKGYFIAQINWDKGPVYYRLIECKAQKSSFIETVPIPLGASSGAIYATTRDTPQARIEHLTLEIH